jgi:hypothetical protein
MEKMKPASRKPHRKTRTGCKTCKQRKIKVCTVVLLMSSPCGFNSHSHGKCAIRERDAPRSSTWDRSCDSDQQLYRSLFQPPPHSYFWSQEEANCDSSATRNDHNVPIVSSILSPATISLPPLQIRPALQVSHNHLHHQPVHLEMYPIMGQVPYSIN